jgi:hypothetical protein
MPLGFQFRAAFDGVPKLTECLVGNVKRAILRPSERVLRQPHFFNAERLTVRMPCVLSVWAAIPDMRARDDERRTILDSSSDG